MERVSTEGVITERVSTDRVSPEQSSHDRTREVLTIEGEPAMQALGQRLADALPERAVITLTGDLGTGKSVLARAILHALGHEGPVLSPTYTIIESYRAGKRRVAHLDLYRLADPGELHDIGFDDIVAEHDMLLIEWPEQGAGHLPSADLAVRIEHAGGERRLVSLDHGPET